MRRLLLAAVLAGGAPPARSAVARRGQAARIEAGSVARAAAVRDPGAAWSALSTAYDRSAGRGAAESAADAPPAPAAAGLTAGAWGALEDWASRELGAAVRPGRAEEWRRAAAAALRDRPGAPLADALARGLGQAHGLGPRDERRAAALFDGRPIPELEGSRAVQLHARPEGLYAFTDSGLHLRKGGAWRRVLAGADPEARPGEDGSSLYVDGKTGVHEVRGTRTRRVAPGGRVAPVVRLAGVEYLATTRGLYARGDGDWSELEAPGRGELQDMAASGGSLYLARGGRVYVRMGEDRWIPIRRGGSRGGLSWAESLSFVAHGGLVYVQATFPGSRPRDSKDRLYLLGGDEAIPVFPEERSVRQSLFSQRGRLYAQFSRGVYEVRDGRLERLRLGSVRLHQSHGREITLFDWKDAFHQEEDGRWLPAPKGMDGSFAHGDRRYAATRDGLHERRGEEWALSREGDFLDAASHEGGLYLAGFDGVTRLASPPDGLPADWREGLQAELGGALAAPPAPSVPEAGDPALDGDGRSLFSGLRRAVSRLGPGR